MVGRYGRQMKPSGKFLTAALLAGAMLLLAEAAWATPGALDTSFGSGGKVITGSGYDNVAYGVAIQPDGKIVAAGKSRKFAVNGADYDYDFTLARRNADGSPDGSFDGDGIVTTAFGSAYDYARAVALQPDGKIVAAGFSSNGANDDFALARYNPDGSLDTGFDGDGKVTTALGSSYDDAYALALQPDGKIVVAGSSSNGTNNDFALARYNPNGSLDASFDADGKLTTAIGSYFDSVYAVALQPDGKIVAAGYSSDGQNYAFALARYLGSTLTVSKSGAGSGTVTSSPAGIDCGPTCSAPYAADVPVTLSATPAAGSAFTGWSGDCSGTGPCTVSMGTDHAVTAAFEPTRTLTVTRGGSGSGGVGSSPGGIDCGSSCSAPFVYGTNVTLTATAASGSRFAGWSGACTGTGQCSLAMSADHDVVATFEPIRMLTVTKGGSGSGSVGSSPAGIDCGATCSASFEDGQGVTLAATPDAGSWFSGWSGACTGIGTCTLAMSQDRDVTATFTLYAADGSGTMRPSTTSVSAGQEHKTITFAYTTATGGVKGGALTLVVPSGWSAPSTTGTAAGYTTANVGTRSVSGQTITVSGLTRSAGQRVVITYGSTAAGGPGAIAPATPGPQTWAAKERSTSGGILSALATSPKITLYGKDGSGTMTSATTSVVHRSNGRTIRFVYTAATGGMSAGAVTLTVPTGWSAPSATGTAPGFTTATVGTVSVSGQTITVAGVTRAAGQTVTITYGSKAAGGPGATAPATVASQTWLTKERSTLGGVQTALASSPAIQIT
jgi:uncharacterized delta-60 repeat protein